MPKDGLDIDSSYTLSQEQVKSFRRNGFVKLKNVLSSEEIEYYGKAITEKVMELNTLDLPMSERTTYQRAFLQITNIWQKSGTVKEFVFGQRLARIAAGLLGVKGVRLYHDQALYKEPGGGFTPWHADQYYWPLATEKTCTVWIPLQETSMEMGPVAFSAQSHTFNFGRDLKISDESEEIIQKSLAEKNYQQVQEPFDLGEVSYHYGWTFHRADGNRTGEMRKVMTIIYMDADMRLKEPENNNQKTDWEVWCPGTVVGELIDTPLNPILYNGG